MMFGLEAGRRVASDVWLSFWAATVSAVSRS